MLITLSYDISYMQADSFENIEKIKINLYEGFTEAACQLITYNIKNNKIIVLLIMHEENEEIEKEENTI